MSGVRRFPRKGDLVRVPRYQLVVSLEQIREALGYKPGEGNERELMDLWNDRVHDPTGDIKLVLRSAQPAKKKPMAEILETK